jgi:hypothetical protein
MSNVPLRSIDLPVVMPAEEIVESLMYAGRCLEARGDGEVFLFGLGAAAAHMLALRIRQAGALPDEAEAIIDDFVSRVDDLTWTFLHKYDTGELSDGNTTDV